jgi:regulation of enolase protein 1 (concanavalin A-like superfamily)
MRIFLILFYLLCFGYNQAQNNLRLSSSDGSTFKVKRNNDYLTKSSQANVLIENIQEDTLKITLEFEDNVQNEAIIYLIEKGKKTTGKEFNYKVERVQHKIKIDFMGIYTITDLPKPLVPIKPVSTFPQQ